ncbi:contractile injection system protein, VgrG/Pvc8 family [Aneurinibacillus uraniidurans]|uniref:contractile injection system protein, VgrG/Pvc8 family n=1 Tax=Aneurinibacillus uraniidurans TaxID=2966586 RepID=UPI00234A0384|nr:contractile injection system protein, VgrG/Pvc8 family [Aneurinibacillus sp. B1]WCN36400.1 contractile injection system protein, VgrG/Pvc8 family [Aneurinibacillus sp. B1]
MKAKVTGYGNVQLISPYEVKSLSEIKIIKTVNDHATLYVKAIIPEEKHDQYIEMASRTDTVQVNQVEEGAVIRSLFAGLVSSVGITTVRGIYYLEIEALSHTCSMDSKLRSRSFQNKDMLYTELIEQVLTAYPDADYIDTASKSSALQKCIIQYQETDWQFLKRMASHFGAVLIPDATATDPKFWFGLAEGRPRTALEHHYSIKKMLSDYRETSENYDSGVADADFSCYTIETHEYFTIGDPVTFKGTERKVSQSVTMMRDGMITHEYILTPEKGIRQNFIVNSQISGVSLQGKVIDVKKDMVRIHLDIDPEQKKKEAYWFSYATPYTAEGNSGWYCMPELEDVVQLYIPSSQEDEALVVRSIRKGGQQNPKTVDPSTKYWGTNNGKEIKMNGTELLLTAKKNKESQLFVKLHEKEGIEIHSDHSIVFTSDKNIEMDLNKKLAIQAGEEVYLLCGSSSIMMDGVTDIRGSRLRIEGSLKKPVVMPAAKEEKKSEEKSGFSDRANLALQAASMIPSGGGGSALGSMLTACIPFAGMTGKEEKTVRNWMKGKVVTGARRLQSNLNQDEVIGKLKNKMKAQTIQKTAYVSAPETRG